MEQNNFILEIDGVLDAILYPDGKCVLTLNSEKYEQQISSITEKIKQLDEQINDIYKKIEEYNINAKNKIIDIRTISFKKYFKGLQQNMQSMLEALAEK